MPRNPNTPCALCGVLLWPSGNVRTEGQQVCNPCRRAYPLHTVARAPVQVARKTECSDKCPGCGVQTRATSRRAGLLCGSCRAKRRRTHYMYKNYQRRHVIPQPEVKMSLAELGDRDGWRCHLCKKRVNKTLKSPHLMSATADHLIPQSDVDETSHEPVNLALAHRICNIRRSNRGPAQLALIG